VPFVAKAIGRPIAKMAARIMAGGALADERLVVPELRHVAIKEAVFPFARFAGVDSLLGPEMKSTGEVMGLDRDFGSAFAKAQLGAGNRLPASGTVFVSVRDADKPALVPIVRDLQDLGYGIVATRGTAQHLAQAGLTVGEVAKAHEGRPHVVDLLKDGRIDLVVNTTAGQQAIRDSYTLRRQALMSRTSYYTTMAGARALVEALRRVTAGELDVAPLQSYFPVVE
ncbi:MAG: carbamoyl phosphate synthase large subunit, partial [Geminicoccaceae bacterium]|nr:carbamoyl phosphate synthase large subunit [Geminicoccaceae bacterium]